jgi:para-nitrobenzyl esterase
MRNLLSFLFLSIPVFVFSQTSPCNEFRFLQVIFSGTESEIGVQYGQNTTVGGNTETLLMDVYDPQGDTATTRIPIILAANGAFSNGSRSDLQLLSQDYASRGYVVFAIDVRPFDITMDGSTTEAQMLDWLFGAATDIKAAVRFIKQETADGNPYGINPNIIFIGGVGTGAMAANHAAMVGPNDNVSAAFQAAVDANGGWEGNSNNITDFDADVRGVVSYSGALVDEDWLDADDPLFLAFHDTGDPEVPFELGIFAPGGTASPLSVFGNGALADRAEDLFIYHDLISSNRSSHVSYLDGAGRRNATANSTAEFIHEVNCENIVSSLVSANVVDRPVMVFPNPADQLLAVQAETEQRINRVYVFDVMGRALQQWENTSVIDVSRFDQGVYLLQVEFGDGQFSRAIKWVKR